MVAVFRPTILRPTCQSKATAKTLQQTERNRRPYSLLPATANHGRINT